ncbi:hypothetical protein BD408DRAFT_438614 [Parasitella parasitica]|nr:hypothetical protein BD408DRAFT_438614 [Parasitella parasitica]
MKEADKLAQHGLVIMKNDMRVCLSHVCILIAGGDLPAAVDLCNHFGFNSKYECRICRTETTNVNHHTCFLERTAADRHINDSKHPDPANAVYDLITVSLNKDTNKAPKFMFTMNNLEYMSHEAFPFWIDRKALIEAGKLVAASKHIKPGVMRRTQHYLLHVHESIQMNGCMPAYSCYSQERAIGRYKKLIKSKSNVGENATKVLERLAVRSYIANLLDDSFFGTLDMLAPRSYCAKSFRDVFCPDKEQMLQLWEPIYCSDFYHLPLEIGKSKFLSALRNFYLRAINPWDDDAGM